MAIIMGRMVRMGRAIIIKIIIIHQKYFINLVAIVKIKILSSLHLRIRKMQVGLGKLYRKYTSKLTNL